MGEIVRGCGLPGGHKVGSKCRTLGGMLNACLGHSTLLPKGYAGRNYWMSIE